MTAQQYVNQVVKLLKCSSAKKREAKAQILADINEKIAGGKTLDEVLAQMGIPWDFANLYNDRFDKSERSSAKREKNIRIGVAVVVALAVIAGIVLSYWPRFGDINESEIFDAVQVENEAVRIVELFGDNDFEDIVKCMNDDMKATLNAATLYYAKSQFNSDFGEFMAIEQVEVMEVTQSGERYAMAQLSVLYANINVSYTVTFDENMKLAGFYFK